MNAGYVERFWSKVDKTETCWLWRGALTGQGYGQFHVGPGKRTCGAHQMAYMLATGSEPTLGMQLDHLCRNRCCVNPAHLELVTQRINLLGGIGPSALNARATHCRHGHVFSSENTYVRVNPKTGRSHRSCRTCHREFERKKRSRL